MTLRQYLFIMSFASALCWSAWIFVLLRIDPFTANSMSFAFFYSSLFLSLVGTTSVLMFVGYYYFSRAMAPMYRHVQHSFRNGLIVSTIIVALLLLQGLQLLTLWTSIILVTFIVVGGIFLYTMKRSHRDVILHR